jgi:hypothetical protein
MMSAVARTLQSESSVRRDEIMDVMMDGRPPVVRRITVK